MVGQYGNIIWLHILNQRIIYDALLIKKKRLEKTLFTPYDIKPGDNLKTRKPEIKFK